MYKQHRYKLVTETEEVNDFFDSIIESFHYNFDVIRYDDEILKHDYKNYVIYVKDPNRLIPEVYDNFPTMYYAKKYDKVFLAIKPEELSYKNRMDKLKDL